MKKAFCLWLCLWILQPFCVSAETNETPVTRIQAVQLLSALLPCGEGGIPFEDTSDPTVTYYRKMGIVRGMEENRFLPDSEISVQDFLLMLKRTIDIAHPDLFYNNQNIYWHMDQNLVAPYAQNQIAMLSTIGIYQQTGLLSPGERISQEMARHYLQLANRAVQQAVRSKNGVLPDKKPPILMYHVIDTPREPFPYLYVSPENFEDQIKTFYHKGYSFLFPEELSLADRVSHPIVITFDDGYEQMYTKAFPILKKYNAKATLYIFSDAIGTDGYCTAQQLYEMSDSGVFRIYSHTKTHSDLSLMTKEQLEQEFAASNDQIYNITKREVTSVAYPYGFFNETVLAQARRYYKTGFSVNQPGEKSAHEITRLTVDGAFTTEQLISLIE